MYVVKDKIKIFFKLTYIVLYKKKKKNMYETKRHYVIEKNICFIFKNMK